jgi:nitrogen fixation protein NifU and related proteins
MSIYQDIILDHYHNPRNKGNLSEPTNSISLSNPLCGDKIHIEIKEDGRIINDIAFSGEGCAISMASASMLTEFVKGKTKEELQKLDKDFVLELLGIELTPNRLKCALLSWEAIMKLVTSS